MSYRFRLFLIYAFIFIGIDAFFSLFYFWSAQRSYGLLFQGSSLTLPMVIPYGQTHWRGPSALLLDAFGVLSPLIALLPYALFFSWLKKCPVWIKMGITLLWLTEIMALGFFIPRISFPF